MTAICRDYAIKDKELMGKIDRVKQALNNTIRAERNEYNKPVLDNADIDSDDDP